MNTGERNSKRPSLEKRNELLVSYYDEGSTSLTYKQFTICSGRQRTVTQFRWKHPCNSL